MNTSSEGFSSFAKFSGIALCAAVCSLLALKLVCFPLGVASSSLLEEIPPPDDDAMTAQKEAAYGEEEMALLDGGLSPDGKYAVCIVKDPEALPPQNYRYAVLDSDSGDVVKSVRDVGGFLDYDSMKEEAVVLWHGGSRCFAVTDRPAKDFQDLCFFSVPGEDSELLPVRGDYLDNALGRVGSVESQRLCYVKPLVWDGDVLNCLLSFSVDKPGSGEEPSRKFYSVEFSLKLVRSEDPASESPFSELRFVSMGAPALEEER